MANLKAIIQKNLGSTLTAAYTNTSGADAALKAFNVNQIGNATAITTETPAGSTSGFLGNAIPFIGSTQGEALPFVIQLSANKLLLLTNLYGVTSATFGRVEAQVVEWDGSKYINYPTTELAISANLFNMNNSGRGIGLYGVALTSSKVAFVTQGVLFVATITNNTVDSTLQTLSATGIFSSIGTRIQTVPNNTNKVVLYGMNAAVTGFVAQAYNVPTGSAPTVAGSTYTAISTSTFTSFDFCLHRRTDATYFFAAFTSSTVVSGNIAVFNDATNVWTTSAATSIIVSGSVSASNPLVTVPLSTDGSSSYYTGVIIGNTSSNFDLFAQTSGTAILTTITATAAAGSNSANQGRGLYYYNLGSRKAIIVGANFITGVSDAGTFTSLYGGGANRDENIPILSLPFNSRPLYFYNINSSYPNLMARTGLTDTGFGTYTETGNFIQYGTPNGKAYVWSDTANCWFAVQGETLYALDLNGNVLAEK
jgi:hypothetical protein